MKEQAKQLADKFDYLVETVERFLELFGFEETTEMLEAYNQKPLQSIRVNTLKITSDELLKKLQQKGMKLESSEFDVDGFIVKETPFSIGATTEYLSGYYFIQSTASWLPVIALQPKQNDLIIDFTAAPGGKATHIAQLMNNKGTLICLDISRERIKSLRSNLSRCGVMNTILIRTDSRKFQEYDVKANKILLDAPCSGEGLMAIDRTRRTKRSLDDITRMNKLQKELLESALNSLEVEGMLVYSTCSTAPEENEEVISWALEKYPIEVVNIGCNNFSKGFTSAFGKNYHPDLNKARRLYPHKNGTEGFFFCKLQLKEDLV
jgi:NOL1/NOP2/sun family putative RNA methylase